jgi:protein O-mannosyl-transferase
MLPSHPNTQCSIIKSLKFAVSTTRTGFHPLPRPHQKGFLGGLVLLCVTGLVYTPAIRAGFVWDDDLLVTANPLLRTFGGLREIWMGGVTTDYTPLTLSTFWMEWHLWGANPLGYHVVNILLHAGSVLLLWNVLNRLAIPGAWIAALLFAVHPVNVASVAWIAERKNTLSLLFYLLAVRWFLGFSESHSRRTYALALLAAACAFLCKGSTVILPAVLLLCVWWMRNRVSLADLVSTAPFFALAAAMAWITVKFQYRLPEARDINVSSAFRLARAGDAIWFYLWKDLWPAHLSAVYPGWTIRPESIATYLPLILAILSMIGLWIFKARLGRGPFFAWSYFLIALLPALGFLNMSFMSQAPVADWWQHIAIIGVVASAGACCSYLIEYSGKAGSFATLGSVACMTVALGYITWNEAMSYKSMELLCRQALAENPNAEIAHDNLGNVLLKQGNVTQAIAENEEAVRELPGNAMAHNNLGNDLKVSGRLDDAINEYREALRLKPNDSRFLSNLGLALEGEGRTDAALACYHQAIQITPSLPEAHASLAMAFQDRGHTDEAIHEYETALELDPDNAEAHSNLGLALFSKGRIDEAALQYRTALRLDPQYAEAYNNLGNALQAQGKRDEAADQYREALRLKPDYAEAAYNLGLVLQSGGRSDLAIPCYQQALRVRPDLFEAHWNLAMAYGDDSRMTEALGQFRAALALRPNDLQSYRTVATILEKHGNHRDATLILQNAASLQDHGTTGTQ